MAKIELEQELYDAISRLIRGSEYDSVDDYVSFVLREVLAESEGDDPARDEQQARAVEESLRKLGYL